MRPIPSLRPTRRGLAVVGLLLGGVGLGVSSGSRALGAVVVPASVTLVAGVVQLLLTPVPTVDRVLPAAGPAEREATVVLSLDADDAFPATVDDRLPAAVSVRSGLPAETVVGDGDVRYRVRLDRRGLHEVGPATVRSTDVLGLVAGRQPVGEAGTVLVYPPVRPLPTPVTTRLRSRVASRSQSERDEFDGLREYVRGDALRNLNWKASAKRDDLIVTEFTGSRPEETLVVAVGADPGNGDEMASAAASVTAALAEFGVVVDLRTPDGGVAVTPDELDEAFAHLATVETGPVPDCEATVVVEAGGGNARIRVDGEETVVERAGGTGAGASSPESESRGAGAGGSAA